MDDQTETSSCRGQGHPEIKPEYAARMSERREALRAEVARVLGNAETPIVLEIGCGHGHFLAAYAEAHPSQLCVGIDINIERVRRGERKRDRARLPNLHFVRAEARMFLGVLDSGIGISSLYILFPDPWPKKRHHKNRIMQAGFLDEVAARMAPGARLYFRTDYAPYFEDAASVVAGHPLWEREEEASWPFDFETVFQKKAKSYSSLVARRRHV